MLYDKIDVLSYAMPPNPPPRVLALLIVSPLISKHHFYTKVKECFHNSTFEFRCEKTRQSGRYAETPQDAAVF